ncbi:MAG: DUF3696 domain-containing protein, partial [Planctomycetes bacterium]|nr:DUF3696 domain-containing protein [Planctomycetota bacterium]
MLTRLAVTNFKSWREVQDMRLAPITGLFGANSSGKTSILQLLLMLKQTVESPDRAQAVIFGDDKSLTKLGTLADVVHGHRRPLRLGWALDWRLPSALTVADPETSTGTLFTGRELSYEASISAGPASRVFVDEIAYRFADDRFRLRRVSNDPPRYELSSDNYRFVRVPGRTWPLPSPV